MRSRAPRPSPPLRAGFPHSRRRSTSRPAVKKPTLKFFYAQELGLFQKAGLNVEISVMQNGSAIGSAIVSNALQVGSSSTLIVANAIAKGLPFAYIAPGGQYADATPSTVLVVPATSTIKTAKDLTGKSIGVLALRGIDQSSAQKWIDDNGGTSSSVKFVEIPPPQMTAALERGTVDAAQLAEPYLGAAKTAVRPLGKAYGSVAPIWLIAGWFCNTDWIAKNPDTVRKFAAVIRETADWANANQPKAAAILQKYAKLNVDHMHTVYGKTLDPALIQPVIDVGVKYGILPKPMNPVDMIAKLPK